MTRDEMIELRDGLQRHYDTLKRFGDYGVGANDIRTNTESLLKLAQHLLDRMRKP